MNEPLPDLEYLKKLESSEDIVKAMTQLSLTYDPYKTRVMVKLEPDPKRSTSAAIWFDTSELRNKGEHPEDTHDNRDIKLDQTIRSTYCRVIETFMLPINPNLPQESVRNFMEERGYDAQLASGGMFYPLPK